MHQPPSAPNHLTARQDRFCEVIAAGENQTDAWLKAGYRVNRAGIAVCQHGNAFGGPAP